MSVRAAAWWASLLILGLVCGCDRRGDGEDSRAPRETEQSEASRGPGDCPSEAEDLVRGRVLIPVSGGSPDTSTAGGRLERPARGVRVSVYRHGEPNRRVAQAETDADGEWCAELPDGTAFGVEWIAEAEWKHFPLRRSLIAAEGQAISIRSEALHRLLNKRVRSLSSVSRASYLNLQAVASTAVDLLDPVRRKPGESPGDLVERVRQRLLEHRRFAGRLETVVSADAAD